MSKQARSRASLWLPLLVCGAVLSTALCYKLRQQPCCVRPSSPDPANNAADCSAFNDSSLVTWNFGTGCCQPDVCRGAELRTIPDLDGRVPAPLLCGMRLFDAAAARQCLANKRVVLLGDSAMGEAGLDLHMLISGAGGDRAAIRAYLRTSMNVTRKHRVQDIELSGAAEPSGSAVATTVHRFADVPVQFSHRHYVVTQPAANISITHRFVGAVDMAGMNQGIATFADPAFQPDLRCLLGENTSCPTPDLLVVNSGLHDAAGGPPRVLGFEQQLLALIQRLQALSPAARTVWAGTRAFRPVPGLTGDGGRFPVTMRGIALDRIAQTHCAAAGLPYVDAYSLMHRFLPPNADHSQYTRDAIHWGARGGGGQEDGKYLTLSSLLTQSLLAAMCPE